MLASDFRVCVWDSLSSLAKGPISRREDGDGDVDVDDDDSLDEAKELMATFRVSLPPSLSHIFPPTKKSGFALPFSPFAPF